MGGTLISLLQVMSPAQTWQRPCPGCFGQWEEVEAGRPSLYSVVGFLRRINLVNLVN